VGAALVDQAVASLPPDGECYVHAQQSALGFWERMGFVAEGAPFHEAGIPHRFMLRTPG
jgi:ElaA protein